MSKGRGSLYFFLHSISVFLGFYIGVKAHLTPPPTKKSQKRQLISTTRDVDGRSDAITPSAKLIVLIAHHRQALNSR